MQEMVEQLIRYIQTEFQKKEADRSFHASSALVKMTAKGIIVKSETD
jgi:hypothetical protein